MGIVPGFNFDVFVSYAHVDNLRLAEEDKGWVTDFHTALYQRLWQELRKEPSIWRDQRDLDGRVADPSIAAALNSSAVFVAVLSPAYVESSYCLAEARDFCAYRHPVFELGVNGFSRVVVLTLGDKLDTIDLPEPVRSAPTVAFNNTDVATGARTRFNKPRRSDPDPYWERLDLMVRHLLGILREMQRGPSKGPDIAASGDSGDSRLPVYLAEATDDLQTERNEIFSLLHRGSKRAGSSVEPSQSILQGVSVRTACREGLARARSSVHLINGTPGRVWGDAVKPLPQMELEEALQAPGKHRPLVWIPPDLKPDAIADPGYREFVTRLRGGTLEARTAGVRTPEVFEMPFDRFVGQIEDRLFPPPPTVWRETRSKQPGGILVYVSYLTADRDPAAALIDGLRGRKYAVAHLDHGGAGADIQQRHQANLRFCDGLVVLYGHDGLSWAEYVALEARMLAHERHRPKRLGLLADDADAGAQFGIVDDLMMPIRIDPSNAFVGLDDFLAALEGDAHV